MADTPSDTKWFLISLHWGITPSSARGLLGFQGSNQLARCKTKTLPTVLLLQASNNFFWGCYTWWCSVFTPGSVCRDTSGRLQGSYCLQTFNPCHLFMASALHYILFFYPSTFLESELFRGGFLEFELVKLYKIQT